MTMTRRTSLATLQRASTFTQPPFDDDAYCTQPVAVGPCWPLPKPTTPRKQTAPTNSLGQTTRALFPGPRRLVGSEPREAL